MGKESPRKRCRGDSAAAVQRVSTEKTVPMLLLTSGRTLVAVLCTGLQPDFSFIPIKMTGC